MTWASYQIRKIAGCACAGNAGNVFPRRRFQRKQLVSDPGMHHGTCVTHVPWCMSGSLTCGDGENVPGIPGACAPAILRIWQEAHAIKYACYKLLQYFPLLKKKLTLKRYFSPHQLSLYLRRHWSEIQQQPAIQRLLHGRVLDRDLHNTLLRKGIWGHPPMDQWCLYKTHCL